MGGEPARRAGWPIPGDQRLEQPLPSRVFWSPNARPTDFQVLASLGPAAGHPGEGMGVGAGSEQPAAPDEMWNFALAGSIHLMPKVFPNWFTLLYNFCS